MNNIAPTVWIKIKNVSNGMFKTEKAVTIELDNGEEVSLFAHESILKQESNNWYLKVTQLDVSNNGIQNVLLPTEAFEISSRWINIPITSILDLQ